MRTASTVLVASLVLAGGSPAIGRERAKVELGARYGVSFLDVESDANWAWDGPTETMTGGLLQGVSLGVRLGDRVLAEGRFTVGPSHERGYMGGVYRCGVEDGGRCMPTFAPESPDCPVPPPIPIPYSEEERMVSYEYGADLVIDLAGRRLHPLLILGAGGITYALNGYSQSDFRLAFGLGLRRDFGNAGVRVEVVDFISPDSFLTGDLEHDVQVTAGVQVGLR